MNGIKIFTDSTSDLSSDLIEENNIGVVPLNVTFGEKVYRDGVDITTEELYRKVEETDKLPITGAVTPNEYYQAFKPYVEKGYKIIYIGLSSKLSSSLQNAITASRMFDNAQIEIIDSLNLSTGIGLLVMKAVDFIKDGLNFNEVVSRVRRLVSRVNTEFVIDTLDYLHKGGRCSGLERFLGSMLRIHPVVKVVDGKMILAEKTRGKKKRVVKRLLERFLENRDSIRKDRVFVTHSHSDKDAEFLQEKLREELNIEEVLITGAGCVISSHCGPGTVGILYFEK
ncbi:DegV family protein [Halothermothrix orenii]|uniref:DegV family protein n=1 Tax=Halothermothrix orenii (strain H 168 / OCM 544 / DSM 9562) TaxID=373903 RepID=B8CY46_HALOH|nr:DegV family protein [Halothermothrix orenii]ACL70215.1 degV family protein [Halothermothrix orenii H 168]